MERVRWFGAPATAVVATARRRCGHGSAAAATAPFGARPGPQCRAWQAVVAVDCHFPPCAAVWQGRVGTSVAAKRLVARSSARWRRARDTPRANNFPQPLANSLFLFGKHRRAPVRPCTSRAAWPGHGMGTVPGAPPGNTGWRSKVVGGAEVPCGARAKTLAPRTRREDHLARRSNNVSQFL